jgi:hypothetical protein
MDNKLKRVFQYAYFVEDLETAAFNWAKLSQAGPFFVTRHHKTE